MSGVPLRTRPLREWPERTAALCLHCAEAIASTPLPAVKYYDQQDDKYWVYGYFCRPCCALAHVSELSSTDTARCMLWTQTVLRSVFGVVGPLRAAPPREALAKFGGKLSLAEFYGEDGTVFKAIHAPPFVTFAMYAEVTRKASDGAPVDVSEVKVLRRPAQRTDPVAVADPTDKPPLILEYLAARGALTLKPPTASATTTGSASGAARPPAGMEATVAAAASTPLNRGPSTQGRRAVAAGASASVAAVSGATMATPSVPPVAASAVALDGAEADAGRDAAATAAVVSGITTPARALSHPHPATTLGPVSLGSSSSSLSGARDNLLLVPAEPARRPRKTAASRTRELEDAGATSAATAAGVRGSMTLASFIVKR
jgi:hypothetical protein